MPQFLLILLIFFAVSGLIGGVCFLFIKLRRRYTRERYAFAALCVAFCLAFITMSAIANYPSWIPFVNLVRSFFNLSEIDSNPLNWSEKVLLFAAFGFIIWLLNRTFTDWDGPISKKHYDKIRFHENANLFIEGIEELFRMLTRNPPNRPYKPYDNFNDEKPLSFPKEELTWKDKSKDLIELKYQQYTFEEPDDWHPTVNSWIGLDLKADKIVIVLCKQTWPDERDFTELSLYIKKLKPNQYRDAAYILALKDDASSTKEEVVVGDIIFKVETEFTLLDSLVDFSDYKAHIRRRVERDLLPDSNLTLRDVYVPSSIKNSEGIEIDSSLDDYLKSWLIEPGQRQLALLGEYGQGKSTGSLLFAYNLLFNDEHGQRIPLLLELRGKSPANLQPLELLGAWASPYRINPRSLWHLIVAGRILLIFEGFDEMVDVADSQDRLNHFRLLWKFCFPKAKLIFTGRPNLFFDDKELKALLGIESPTHASPYCIDIHLCPFDDKKIAKSISWMAKNDVHDILSLSKQSKPFCDIVSRPSLLYVISRIWKTPEFSNIKENISSADVMSAFIKYCYRRQSEKHNSNRQFMVLTESERKYFMDGIASYMASNRLKNQILKSQLQEITNKLYTAIPNELPHIEGIPKENLRPLKKRLESRENALDAVETDVRTCGLIVRDYSRYDAFKFSHKSFFEFMIADVLVNKILNKKNEYYACIYSTTRISIEILAVIPESLVFVGELIHSKIKQQKDKDVSLMNKLFDMIVLSTNFPIPAFCKRIVVLEATSFFIHRQRILKRLFQMFLRPSFMLFFTGYFLSFVSFLGRTSILRKASFFNIREFPFVFTSFEHNFLLGSSMFMMFSGVCMIFFARKVKPKIAIWYSISLSSGYPISEIAKAFGNLALSGIRNMSSRYLPNDAIQKLENDAKDRSF